MDIVSIIGQVITPELISSFVTAVIGLAVTTLTAVGVTFLKAHTSAAQFQLLQDIAASAVNAAEQGQLGGFVTDKKASAMAAASAALATAGIKVDPSVLDAAIEAAVLNGFNTSYAPTVIKGGEDAVVVQPDAA